MVICNSVDDVYLRSTQFLFVSYNPIELKNYIGLYKIYGNSFFIQYQLFS